MYLQIQRSNQMMFSTKPNKKFGTENNIMQGYGSDDDNFPFKSKFMII